ncbi:MAG: hypothetical protein OEW90_01780 [Betaproteobacteria bacterium]|nr:hypothetical protein [Betaproteobacteria bacterium]MDH4322849.1 hypothetical protein [Betaproteobacteria bacterium]MDH5210107.1 hypothetical protein [Betaproteobacteria bacterium]
MKTVAAALTFAPGLAWAHPGHGVELMHAHGELALLVVLVVAVAAWWRR